MNPKRMLASAMSGLPTLVTLIVIAAIAYVGHRTNWTIPHVSKVFGNAQPARDNWCADHGVPESDCIQCKKIPVNVPGAEASTTPAPAAVDWCSTHGVPESVCTRCNPDLIAQFKAKGDWCSGHNVPESQCIECNPDLKAKFQAMDPRRNKSQAAPPLPADRLVQLATGQVATQAGIESQQAQVRKVTQYLEVNAEVRYDMTRYAQVSPRAGGSVSMVLVQSGQPVKRGDVLALIDSAEVGKAKAEFLSSAATLSARNTALERIRSSTEQGFRNKSDLLAAEAELREASIRLFNSRQSLVNLGMTVPEIKSGEIPDEHSVQLLGLPQSLRTRLDPQQTSANLIPLLAPLDGIVVTRSAVEGEIADSAKPLFVVADTSRMWIKLDVPLGELKNVRKGQDVSFTADGMEEPAIGVITWISTEANDHTRVVEARAEVPNTNGRLLANMFGRARLGVASNATAHVIPESALQWDGTNHLVFLKVRDDVYLARIVKPGIREAGMIDVAGIASTDRIVVKGAYSLLAQLNRGKLGAGCCD